MRFLEVLLFSLVLLPLLVRLIPRIRGLHFFRLLWFAAIIITPVQILLEGFRWQMTPLYFAALLLACVGILQFRKENPGDFIIRNKFVRHLFAALLIVILVASFIFPALLPVARLPLPKGAYTVGTASFEINDIMRQEWMTSNPDDTRRFAVRVWYPADAVETAHTAPYWDRAGITGKAYSQNAGMGSFWYSHLTLVATNSIANADISTIRDNYPVVIYSPSFYSLSTDNTMLFEELASNGYIVFSINHTYESIVSLFPDGEAIPGDLSYLSDSYPAHADLEEQYYLDYADTDLLEYKTSLIQKILTVDESTTAMIRIRTQDVVSLIDELFLINDGITQFAGKLDLTKICVMGWSFGGATALDACVVDNRIQAGINLDGWPYGEQFNAAEAIRQPVLLIRSERRDEMEDIVSGLQLEKLDNPACVVSIDGAWHENFWDFPYFFPIYHYLGYWGPINPNHLLAIESAYILAFLRASFNDSSADYAAITAGYQEAELLNP